MGMKIRYAMLVLTFVLLSVLCAYARHGPQVAPQPNNRPAPRPTQIVIRASPNAHVYLDDVFIGKANAKGTLVIDNPKPGTHMLRVSLAGKRDFHQQFFIIAGLTVTVNVTQSDVARSNPVQTPPRAVRSGESKPEPIRVDGQEEFAKLLYEPYPEYPKAAKLAMIQGTVRFQALISKDGKIKSLKVLSGHPLLVKPAMDAVRRYRYQPTLVKGKPVEVLTEIDVNFTLVT
jgi:TonB family protein